VKRIVFWGAAHIMGKPVELPTQLATHTPSANSKRLEQCNIEQPWSAAGSPNKHTCFVWFRGL
jgi:hypothetical protein